jgi:kynurenine formamidase
VKRVASLGLCMAVLMIAPGIALPAEVSSAQFEQWMKEISNWGRWGADDELGTLNLITPAVRKSAAALVEDGEAVSLALELNKTADTNNTNPFEHKLSHGTFGGHEVASDRYAVDYHGFAHSHMDGLPHFVHDGKMYNGVPASVLQESGATRLGIENAWAGVFTRGVLVDMPWLKGVPWLEPGTAITIEDLEAWEKRTGVRVQSGDVLLVRTGRWQRIRDKGTWNFLEAAAGLHASVAPWLKARDVAVIGCDGVSDVMPSGVENKVNPLHELVLVGLGMPILDNLDLDAVAAAAAKRNRWTFLYVGAPLRIPGGTGSPLNPLAIF